MRDRRVNESAVAKTQHFLNNLQAKCENRAFQRETVSYLHTFNSVSKSTYSACKALEIVKETKDGLEWVKENPNREMCLQILDYLLSKSKKRKDIPLSPDFLTSVERIVAKLDIIANQNERASNRVKSPQNRLGDNTGDLFRVDSDRLYIAGQMVSLFRDAFEYNQVGDEQAISRTSDFIIRATDTLLLKLKAK